jgi:hypothetical protein
VSLGIHSAASSTTLSLRIDGNLIEEHAQGDGQFDAL